MFTFDSIDVKFRVDIFRGYDFPGVEFPIFLLIFEWALQRCSATALPVIVSVVVIVAVVIIVVVVVVVVVVVDCRTFKQTVGCMFDVGDTSTESSRFHSA